MLTSVRFPVVRALLGGAALLLVLLAPLRVSAQITGWGYDHYGAVSNAPTGTGFTAIAGGGLIGFALKAGLTPGTPEPGACALLVSVGLSGVAFLRRKRAR
jgi:hypothetical protein